jgi:hypothetical protein
MERYRAGGKTDCGAVERKLVFVQERGLLMITGAQSFRRHAAADGIGWSGGLHSSKPPSVQTGASARIEEIGDGYRVRVGGM